MSHVLSLLVEDKPGLLTRVAGLFARRGFNIESLAVGKSEIEGLSRITVVVDVEELPLEQVTKQLNKLVNVIKIVELDPEQSVLREHLLIKVRVDNTTRSQILEAVNLFRARVVDVAPDALVIEVTGDSGKVAGAAARARALRHQGDRAVRAARHRPRQQVHHRQSVQELGVRPHMTEIFYDKDADLSLIQGKKVAVIGYGSQGHAHALNLRDSGVEVKVGLKPDSKSVAKAQEAGFEVLPAAEAAKWADVVVILAPDQHQRGLFAADIKDNLERRQRHPVRPRVQHPVRLHHPARGRRRDHGRAEGSRSHRAPRVRGRPWRAGDRRGRAGCDRQGLGSRLVVRAGRSAALRAGGIKTTFTEETETDLFGEQAVLCGGTSQLVQYGFETLIEAGYQPQIAYFEVLHELKLIVDLMWEGGIAKQRWSVSDTAEYGDYVSGPRIIDPQREGEHEDGARRHPVRARSRSASSPTRMPVHPSSRSCARRAPPTRSRPPARSCAPSSRGSSRTPTTRRAAPPASRPRHLAVVSAPRPDAPIGVDGANRGNPRAGGSERQA